MSTILIKNAQLVRDNIKEADVFIRDGVISKIGKIVRNADIEIDAKGKHLFYGFFDMHTHLREPGFEAKETIGSGVRSAVKGGFTDIACMPNTNPVNDNYVVTKYIIARAEEEGFAKVYPIGAITKNLQGEQLTEMAKLKKVGAVAVSDDGNPVESAGMMRLALEYADSIGMPIISHAEDKSLSNGGVANEGLPACEVGLKGITRASEEVATARELILADTLSCSVHIAHVSTRGAVELIRFFKKKGVKVTAETCPHYFALNDECVRSLNTYTKVNPPLRSEDDRVAIIEGIMDGTIDVIASDHAPHAQQDKDTDYDSASFGISGLETSFAVSYTVLVKSGLIDLVTLSKLMSVKPREILGIGGKLREGDIANLTLVDLEKEYTINSRDFVSNGKNTPFNGLNVCGYVSDVIVGGKLKLLDGKIVE